MSGETGEYARFLAMVDVAKDQGFGLARGYGSFVAYYPGHDPRISEAERADLSAAPRFDDDAPEGYKIHINPADDQLPLALAGIAGASWRSPELREALYEAKVWVGGTGAEFDHVPRVVLYPRSGSAENALTTAHLTLAELGRLGVRASGRRVAFNVPILEGFAYIAQGNRSRKEEDPAYKAQFDPSTDYAALTVSSSEMRVLLDDIKKKL